MKHIKKDFSLKAWVHNALDVFLTVRIVFILANSLGPDEMQQYAAFHLGLHCLPKYTFRELSSIQRVRN